MRNSFFLFFFVFAALPAAAQDETTRFLFTNIHVFDGVNEQRIENAHVLIEGNRIVAVSTEALDPADARIIDGGGRTMIPGLIDSHQHVMLASATDPYRAMLYGSIYETAYNAIPQARKILHMGITSIRDLGGPSIELGRAIDAGYVVGPRILSAGHFVGATSGHGDFAGQRRIGPSEAVDSDANRLLTSGWSILADGPDDVRWAAHAPHWLTVPAISRLWREVVLLR